MSLASQTQPTPALIAFRILKTICAGLGLVGSGLRDYVRGYNVYKDIWEASTGEQLLYANARIATVLISLLWRLSRGYFRLVHVE